MFAFPLFRNCREAGKFTKIKGTNFDTCPSLTDYNNTSCVRCKIAKIQGAKVISRMKSPNSRAAKLKGYTTTSMPGLLRSVL